MSKSTALQPDANRNATSTELSDRTIVHGAFLPVSAVLKNSKNV